MRVFTEIFMYGFDNMMEFVPVLQRDGLILFFCLLLIFLAVLFDMWTGVDAARAVGEPISSHSLRLTLTKALDYFRVVLFGLLIDLLAMFFPWWALPFCSMACTLGVLLIEGKSVLENFRKKKSPAGDVGDMVSKIIKATTSAEAEKIIKELKN